MSAPRRRRKTSSFSSTATVGGRWRRQRPPITSVRPGTSFSRPVATQTRTHAVALIDDVSPESARHGGSTLRTPVVAWDPTCTSAAGRAPARISPDDPSRAARRPTWWPRRRARHATARRGCRGAAGGAARDDACDRTSWPRRDRCRGVWSPLIRAQISLSNPLSPAFSASLPLL